VKYFGFGKLWFFFSNFEYFGLRFRYFGFEYRVLWPTVLDFWLGGMQQTSPTVLRAFLNWARIRLAHTDMSVGKKWAALFFCSFFWHICKKHSPYNRKTVISFAPIYSSFVLCIQINECPSISCLVFITFPLRCQDPQFGSGPTVWKLSFGYSS
jgi:hypothetical protein